MHAAIVKKVKKVKVVLLDITHFIPLKIVLSTNITEFKGGRKTGPEVKLN